MSGERAPNTDSTYFRLWLGLLLVSLLAIFLVRCVCVLAQEIDQVTPITALTDYVEELNDTRGGATLVYILLASIAISLITIVLEGLDRVREQKRALRH